MKKIVTFVTIFAAALMMIPAMVFAVDSYGSQLVYLDGTEIENGDGTQASPYNNFKDAMTAVKEGGTIRLLDDYEKESATSDDGKQNRVEITKNITLDLNHYKIRAFGSGAWYGVSVNAGVNATVQNGEIICNKPTSGTVIVANGGEANIVDCTVKAEKSKPTVYLNAGSTLIGAKTTFVSAPNAYYGIYNEAEKVHLADCTVDASGVTASYHYGINLTSSDMLFENCTINMPEGEDAYELVVEDGNTAVISGGKINGNIRAAWKSNGTLKIEGDTVIDGQIVHVGNGTNNTASRIELAGGKYTLTENLISVKDLVKGNIIVSGGLFKNEAVVSDFVKEPYKIIPNIGADSDEYPYTIQSIPEGTVASVGNKTFTSLEDAMAAAKDGKTVILVSDVEADKLYGNINGNGKTITYKGTLDALSKNDVTLTNANVKCTDGEISSIVLSDGRLTGGVVKRGNVDELLAENYFVTDDTNKIADVSTFAATIGKTGYPAIINATTAAARTPEKETIVLRKNSESRMEEVIPNANYILDLNGYTMNGFFIVPIATGSSVPNNADITIIDSSEAKTGKIVSKDNFSVGTNGTLENIKLTLDGITVESKVVAGIYFPSSGTLTIKNSKITGTTGVEIRGGDLEVDNSEITATAEEFKEAPNESGSTITGAAIAISQHTTNHEINVNIKSGTFKGIKSLYETDLQDEDIKNIQIAVTGGTFDGEVGSKNVKAFITGGAFTKEIDESLIADGFLEIQKDNGWYVGKDAENIVETAKPGDKIIIILSPDKNIVVPEGVIVENKTGDKISVNDKIVEGGETVTAPTPEKPSAPGGDGEQPDEGNSNPEDGITDGVAKTGDDSHPALLFAVAAVALCAGVAIFVSRKKHD